MEKKTGIVLVGTAGWEHEDFDRVFYPVAGMDGRGRLEAYAATFDAVEVRSTFWDDRLGGDDAREWADAVGGNSRFRFLVKLHQSFTHRKTISPGTTRTARALLQELARQERLGAVLLQFPFSFTNTSSHRFHLTKLSEIFAGFPLHAEFRHDSWNQPSLLPFLAEFGLRPVNADLPRVAHLMPFTTGTIGDTAYLRLHGRNDRGWLTNGWDARYDYLYNGRELREIARRISLLTERCRRVVVVCNNTTGGKAVATALQLSAAAGRERKIAVPEKALAAFPVLQEIARPACAGALFQPAAYKRAG